MKSRVFCLVNCKCGRCKEEDSKEREIAILEDKVDIFVLLGLTFIRTHWFSQTCRIKLGCYRALIAITGIRVIWSNKAVVVSIGLKNCSLNLCSVNDA